MIPGYKFFGVKYVIHEHGYLVSQEDCHDCMGFHTRNSSLNTMYHNQILHGYPSTI